MTQSFTIIAKIEDLRGINSSIRAFAGKDFERDGPLEDWSAIRLTTPGGTLQLNSLKFTEPQDEFSKIKLGLHNRVRQIETEHEEIKQRLLDCIGKSTLMIGIVAEPEVIAEDGHEDIIFGCVERVEGYLFDGFEFLNEDGDVELDLDGNSETQ